MTQIGFRGAQQSGNGIRLRRLPFVLMLTIGLLLSLIHCAGCGLAFASADTPAVTMSNDAGSPPDMPDQQLPAHCGHCLSHVTAQVFATIDVAVDLIPHLLVFGQEQSPASLAGLPLFKPPRV